MHPIIGNKKEAQKAIGKLDISLIINKLDQKKRPKPGGGFFEEPIFYIPQVLEEAKKYFLNLPNHQKQIQINSAIQSNTNGSSLLPEIQK